MFRFSTATCLLLIASALGGDESADYHGAQVFRLATSPLHPGFLHDIGVDVWAHNRNFTDVMVTRSKLSYMKRMLEENGIDYDVMIANVQAMIERESLVPLNHEEDYRFRGEGVRFDNYNRLDAIHNYLDLLANNYSDIVTVGIMGYSHENRPLKYIKVSSSSPDAKAFFIEGGIHAREWISPAVVLYIIRELVENRHNLPKHILDLDFYILPVVNPDGYEFTHTSNRLWRKNRSKSHMGCRGVDLNRNFGFKWGGKGTSGSTCSEIYRGPKAFSEPESRAIADFILSFKNDIEVYLSLHSYSQLILLPYGYDRVYPENFKELKSIGNQAAQAMIQSGGEKYVVGNTVDILYEAAGGSFDWALGEAGIKYSMTMELRDTGRYGFLLPAKQILPTSKEVFEAVKVIASAVTS